MSANKPWNYESTEQGDRRRKSCIVGTVEKLPTKAHAQKAVEALLLTLNSETPQQRMAAVTFGAICAVTCRKRCRNGTPLRSRTGPTSSIT
jgi:hypothetical protein